MAKDSASRRAWVKNIAIIFLVILLLLTFFSNTILNYSLPEVSAQYANYGTLSTSTKLSGSVKANESYNVVYESEVAEQDAGLTQSRKVVSVYVKEGDYVEKDAVILTLQGGASEQLAAAEKEIDDAKYQYNLKLLERSQSNLGNSSTLSKLKEELADLQEKYNKAVSGTYSIELSTLEEELKSLKKAQEEVNALKSKAENDKQGLQELVDSANDAFTTDSISERLADAENRYAVAESEYTTLKAEKDKLEEQKQYIQDASSDIGKANELTNQIKTLEDQLDTLAKEFERDWEDYNENKQKLYEQLRELNEDPETTDDEINQIKDQLAALDKEFSRNEEDSMEQMQDLEDQILDARQKLEVIGYPQVDDVIDYAVTYDLSTVENELTKVTSKLTEAETEYNDAKTAVETLRKQSQAEIKLPDYSALVDEYTKQYDDYQDQIDILEQEISELTIKDGENKVTDTVSYLTKAIENKKLEITTKELEIQVNEAPNTKSISDYEKQIAELETKIEAYKNAPETTSVTAPIAGRVVSVNYVPGDSLSSGATVASIEVADKGYVVEVTLASEEARKIQVGSPISIVNSWWYSNIEASITQIRSDAKSQGKNRIIVIEVTGDVYEGQELNFSVGDKSQSYDTVLPNSAIREDNDGKFVLIVESKSTPLGTRYTARRRTIEVIASDDTKSAVSGLYGSEFVITNSTSPISDNQQVRLAENG